MCVRRIVLELAPSVRVEFTDRDRALKQVEEWAVKSTRYPVVIFGPEGCGKTAFLKQAAAALRELGYNVFYLNPLEKEFAAEIDEGDVKTQFYEFVQQSLADEKWGRVALGVLELVRELLRRRKRRVAIIADDVFQAIGLDKAAQYVKGLLGIIEYPPESYEGIVALAATSEGVSRWEIGRHRWAHLRPMWNMSREGFAQLYEKLPGPKPPLEDAWRWTGGNPDMLARLYEAGWDVERVVKSVIDEKGLTPSFVRRWRRWLIDAVGDPDALMALDMSTELEKAFIEELIRRNLIVYGMHHREPDFWVDQPPPERDPELGIGRYVAWHTPVHREAVKRAVEGAY
jgi:energy-coupling factor transporter ATP-binding protein EcfA2